MILYGLTTSWLIGMSLWSSFLIQINKSWTNWVFVIELIEEENSMDLIAFPSFWNVKNKRGAGIKIFFSFRLSQCSVY